MLISFIMVIALFLGGCTMLDQALLPEEGKMRSDTVVMVDALAKGLAATGNPYAVPALAGSTLFAIIAGAYTNMRKKQKLDNAAESAKQSATVTESVIKAIEDASDIKIGKKGQTIGSVVKEKVSKNLRDKDAYLMGKAIIEAMKESR
jgi:hypothetical protein